jgi:hypothetical protein
MIVKYYQDKKLLDVIDLAGFANEDIFCDSILMHINNKIDFLLESMSTKKDLERNILSLEIKNICLKNQNKSDEEADDISKRISGFKDKLRKIRFETSFSYFISNDLLMLYRIKPAIEEKNHKKIQQLDELIRKHSMGGTNRAKKYQAIKEYVFEKYNQKTWQSKRQAALCISNNLPNQRFGSLVTKDTIYKWLRGGK